MAVTWRSKVYRRAYAAFDRLSKMDVPATIFMTPDKGIRLAAVGSRRHFLLTDARTHDMIGTYSPDVTSHQVIEDVSVLLLERRRKL